MVMEDLTKGEPEVEQSLNKSRGQSAAFWAGERVHASRQLGCQVRAVVGDRVQIGGQIKIEMLPDLSFQKEAVPGGRAGTEKETDR